MVRMDFGYCWQCRSMDCIMPNGTEENASALLLHGQPVHRGLADRSDLLAHLSIVSYTTIKGQPKIFSLKGEFVLRAKVKSQA